MPTYPAPMMAISGFTTRKASCDPLRRRPVAVQLRALVGHARGGDLIGEPRGGVVDEGVGADLHRVDPFRRRSSGHARDAVPVRLLLQPAGVGDDHACLRAERGHVEVAERLDYYDVRGDAVDATTRVWV